MGGWTYDSGQWNVYCDVCKRKIKAGEAKHRWDGFIVCPDDWEPRQPQDFVKAKIDKIMVPFSRPTENTNNSVQYGDFDVVIFQDTISITRTQYIGPVDTVSYVDDFVIFKDNLFYDYVSFSDNLVITTTYNSGLSDTVSYSATGYFYNYDYTTPFPPDPQTYFAEDYVGLLVNFY